MILLAKIQYCRVFIRSAVIANDFLFNDAEGKNNAAEQIEES